MASDDFFQVCTVYWYTLWNVYTDQHSRYCCLILQEMTAMITVYKTVSERIATFFIEGVQHELTVWSNYR